MFAASNTQGTPVDQRVGDPNITIHTTIHEVNPLTLKLPALLRLTDGWENLNLVLSGALRGFTVEIRL